MTKNYSVAPTTTSTSIASKLASKCRQACRSADRQQISGMTMTLESVTKHRDTGTRLDVGVERSSAPNAATTALPQSTLPIAPAATAGPDEQSCVLHPLLRQHPGQSQHQDQASLDPMSHRGEMRTHLAPASVTNHGGRTPWSPEDVYAHQYELNHNRCCFGRRHSEVETLLQLRGGLPAANLPAYYDLDTSSLPSYDVSQQVSGFVVDIPLRPAQHHSSTLSIDPDEKPSPPARNPKRLTMSKTPITAMYQGVGEMTSMMHNDALRESLSAKQHGRVRKSAINTSHLRPHPSRPEGTSPPVQLHATPSPLRSHPCEIKEIGDFPMPPAPPKNSRRSTPPDKLVSNGQDRPFDVDPLDQHKTNVRRPPKGIQHWFDAYISSEDENDSGDGQDADVEQAVPQKSPAEAIPRPAYIVPERGSSRAVDINTRIKDPVPDSAGLCSTKLHSPAQSESSNSIQSSHCRGRRRTLGVSRRLTATNLAQESVLSLSSSTSDYSGEDNDGDDDDEVPGLPTIRDSIRDSIFDDRNFEVASAASIRVQRLSPSEALNAARRSRLQPQRSMDTLRSIQSYVPAPRTQTQHAPPAHQHLKDTENVDATLRRLNGSSSAKHSVESMSPGGSEVAHVVAVTDEEMMFLEMIRKKRAEMRQELESFAEGYSVALQTEQQRLAKRNTSTPQAAPKVSQKKRNEQSRHEQALQDQERRSDEAASVGAESSTSEMQQQLEGIRKAQVDAGFQIERFLGMSSTRQSPYATHAAQKPREDLLLPATVYSPTEPSPRKAASLGTQSDVEDRVEAQRRVEQFIASQGAVPPLNSIKNMRRPSHQALSPTRAVEQAMPSIQPLRKSRTGPSSSEADASQRHVSITHPSRGGTRHTSPVSAVTAPSSSSHTHFEPARLFTHYGTHQGSMHSAMHSERPRTASGPVSRRVTPRRSLPRLNTEKAFGSQRSSTLDDVLESWHDLGGSGFKKSPGKTGQSV